MRSLSVRKVLLVSTDKGQQEQFQEVLLNTGIPVESMPAFNSWKGVLQRRNGLILLNPPYDDIAGLDVFSTNPLPERCIFVFTKDARWKQKANAHSVFYLPDHTHPLELARLLVEKLNLPAVSNKPSYAFSFFQF